MFLSVLHRTTFDYETEIADTAMEVRLRPRDGTGQRCLAYALEVDPLGPVRGYRDSFGNLVEAYNHRPPHRRVVIAARSLVTTGSDALEMLDPGSGEQGVHGERRSLPGVTSDLPPAVQGPGERARWLRLDGPVGDVPGVREIAARLGGAGVPGSSQLLAALTEQIHRGFVYEPNATRVDSTVADLLRLGRGVCQDFAHLWISVCRLMGVPARYVSGYIWPGDSGLPQASHAWGEAWVAGAGWEGWDPTNWSEQTGGRVGEAHVRVAVGRDYRDVPPTRGVFRGTAREVLGVEVHVERLDAGSMSTALEGFGRRTPVLR